MMMSQVQRDRSSFAEPCYVIGDGRLCIFYKARTLHTNCARAHGWRRAHCFIDWWRAYGGWWCTYSWAGAPGLKTLQSYPLIYFIASPHYLWLLYMEGRHFANLVMVKRLSMFFLLAFISSIAGRFCCPTFFLKASTKYSKFWRKTI